MKILYQSFVNRRLSEPYIRHLSAYIQRIRSADTDVIIGELDPPDSYAHPLVEYVCGNRILRCVHDAQRSGFDAVILGHFQDTVLEEAKAIVDIPVMGLGEVSFLFACTLARKIGVVTINPRFIPVHEKQIARYGLESRVTGVRAITYQAGELTAAFDDPDRIRGVAESFMQQAQPLVDAGAEIIVPAGGIPMLLVGMGPRWEVGGAPVLNAIPVLLKFTELAVDVAKLNGFHVSRTGPYAQPPPDVIEEFITNYK